MSANSISNDPQTLQVGAAMVRIMNVADIQGAMSAWMDEPEHGWAEPYAARLKAVQWFPMQCVHVALHELTLLVDAGAYSASPESPFAIPDYERPPGLLDQLRSVGVGAEEIRHVVITHPHYDHINGLVDGAEPCFPRARHYLGRADWERAEMQQALRDPQSLESQTLGVLHQHGLLDLVEGELALAEGVAILAAPGETPGHQIVRVRSEGQTLYCAGDLFHHVVEAEQPELMVRWADRAAILASRRGLIEAAVAEDAIIVATHIPGGGRLRRTAAGVSWEES